MASDPPNVIPMPGQERWLFSVDVFRQPDGTLVARLADMQASDIRPDVEPRRALEDISAKLELAAQGMRREAENIGLSHD